MLVGNRLRTLRESKNLSQADIEQRTGLRRCYISRVENGRTIPSVETLERLAHGLEMKLYQFLYDGDGPPPLRAEHPATDHWPQSHGYLQKMTRYLSRMKESDRHVLLDFARRMGIERRKH